MSSRKKVLITGAVVLLSFVAGLFHFFGESRKFTYETFFPFRLYNHQYIYRGAVKQLITRAYTVTSAQDSLQGNNLRYTYITNFDREIRQYNEFKVITGTDTSLVVAEYDAKGRLQRITFEDGSTSQATYTAEGFLNQVMDRDKEGHLTRRELFRVEQGQYLAKTSHDLVKQVDRTYEYSWYPEGQLQSVKVYTAGQGKRQLEEELDFTYAENGRSYYERKHYTGTGVLEEAEATWLYDGFPEKSTIVTWGDTSRFINLFVLDKRGNPLKTTYYLNGEVYQVDVFEYDYY
jgi:YD repeat-containing protein